MKSFNRREHVVAAFLDTEKVFSLDQYDLQG